MKRFLQPKYILLFIFLVAAFFLLRKEFQPTEDILKAGDQSEKVCPVHHIHLKLDVVPIALRKVEPDSSYIILQKNNFPMALDTFFILEPLHGEQFEHTTKAEVWYCQICRDMKKKYQIGQPN
jgi:hypothetical protein